MSYEYIAVKIKALPHWLWFTASKVTEADGQFVGKGGWGPGGCRDIVRNADLTK